MKPITLWGFRQLIRTQFFQSRPLLAPLLRTVWRYLRAATPEAGVGAVRALAMSHFAGYPILFRDRYDLEYLLYPDQNAEVYIANDGNYEVGETQFCLDRLGAGMVCFDVGANIGLYTLLFAKCVGPTGHVHAFEPEPRNYRRLLVNLAINGFENVTTNPAAVFSGSQPVTLNVYPERFHALHSLGQPLTPDPRDAGPGAAQLERQLTVPGSSLDDYCAKQGVERIDYLKVDVEGAELDVLQGARELMARRAIRLIQFEASPSLVAGRGHAPGDLFDLLRCCGFHCHPIAKTGQLLAEISMARKDFANYAALT